MADSEFAPAYGIGGQWIMQRSQSCCALPDSPQRRRRDCITGCSLGSTLLPLIGGTRPTSLWLRIGPRTTAKWSSVVSSLSVCWSGCPRDYPPGGQEVSRYTESRDGRACGSERVHRPLSRNVRDNGVRRSKLHRIQCRAGRAELSVLAGQE